MRYKKSSEEILPDKGMILQFINGKDISDEVIEFYDKYIIKISELMIIDSEYNIEVKYIDSDLMQDLYLSILECLRRWTKGYTIKQPNMDCQPTEITALMRHRAVFS